MDTNPIDEHVWLYGEHAAADPIGEPADLTDVARLNRWADACTRAIDQIDAMIGAEVDRLTERREELAGSLITRRADLLATIEAWHRAQLADRKVPTTLRFPTGPPSALRANPLKHAVTDQDALDAFLASTPTADGEYLDAVVFTKPTPPEFRVSELKKRVDLPKTPKGGWEPGQEVRATYRHPSGEVVPVPGIVWRSTGRRWQQKA